MDGFHKSALLYCAGHWAIMMTRDEPMTLHIYQVEYCGAGVESIMENTLAC